MTDLATGIKTASGDRVRAGRRAIGWADVLRAVELDDVRSYVLGRYRGAGFSPDNFGHSRAAREAMADALSRTEDWLELQRGSLRQQARASIREVRRQLERECRV